MSIPADIAARLSALPVPVLLPEQADVPREYAQTAPDGLPLEGGRTGLLYYLEAHAPQGYVQVEGAQPFGVSLGGAGAQWLVTVTCVSTTEAGADDLAAQVQLIASAAGRRQTPYDLFSPATTRLSAPGVFASTLILLARKGI